MSEVDVDFYPVYIKSGLLFSFYANLDTPEDDLTFSRWSLKLVHCDTFQVVFDDIGVLVQDFIDASNYRFYSTFVFPDDVPVGQYRLIIVDEYDDQVKFISNIITVFDQLPRDLIRIQYRNTRNMLNYGYERIPSTFYNRFFVKLVSRAPTFPVNQKGYDLINGRFNPVRATSGKTREFVTTQYNENDHEAFNAATVHNQFEVFENGKFESYNRGDAEYNIEWADVYPEYPLADGRITLQKEDTYKSSKNIE